MKTKCFLLILVFFVLAFVSACTSSSTQPTNPSTTSIDQNKIDTERQQLYAQLQELAIQQVDLKAELKDAQDKLAQTQIELKDTQDQLAYQQELAIDLRKMLDFQISHPANTTQSSLYQPTPSNNYSQQFDLQRIQSEQRQQQLDYYYSMEKLYTDLSQDARKKGDYVLSEQYQIEAIGWYNKAAIMVGGTTLPYPSPYPSTDWIDAWNNEAQK